MSYGVNSLIKSIQIRNLKGIKKLKFQLPTPGVHLLAGTNGAGKTTLLACLRRIGQPNAFQVHFLNSFESDRLDSFKSAEISYSLDERSVTYAYAGERWVPRPRRESKLLQEFGYPDVLYIGATASRITPRPEDFSPSRLRPAPASIVNAANTIFETERFSLLKTINLTSGNGNQAFVLTERRPGTQKVSYFSEKNFSLGELCILKLLRALNKCQNGSLVLIDELELALHPRAQVGLIKHLESLAAEKALTVIVSTHSVSLIKRTHSNRMMYVERRVEETIVMKRCFPAYALGAIALSEERIPDAVIYVEDEAAKLIVELLLARCIASRYSNEQGLFPSVRVLPIGDYQNVIGFYDKNRAVLPNYVRHWIILDKDVETEIVPILAPASNHPMRDLFHRSADVIRYLPWTPEVGLVNFLFLQREDILTRLRAKFLNPHIQLTPQMVSIPTELTGRDIRKHAKKQLKAVIEHICEETTGTSANSVKHFLFESFAESFFAENRASTMQLIGPMIS